MKVVIDGQVRDIKPTEFRVIGEAWCEYALESGEIIRAKFVMTHVFDAGQKDSAGNPIYQFVGQPVFAVHS